MIHIDAARKLLDFNARGIGERRAEEQLAGAVAMHNILERHKVAYLADEVGMGKTYVALGAMALLRHFNSECRVLVIAPRENIQRKWIKELGNFARNNVRFADLRTKSLRGGPARPMVRCDSLRDFVHEVTVDSRRDFFVRLSSFSLGLGSDTESWKTERNNLRRELPWLADEIFDLRSKERFKENFARAMCCALPVFDLVIVDEGHNLKRGYSIGSDLPARNCVLALALGHSPLHADPTLFPGYGNRVKRLLILSATPIEDSYKHLWNQLDLFSLGGSFSALKQPDVPDEEKKKIAAQILVRRVTTAMVNGTELTKNQYRREWRQGGVQEHDHPIEVVDPRKRLVVALIQKKVAELLGSGKFNMSFQIGMLASFESFLQTAKVQREDDVVFDDEEQKRDLTDVQKQGVDVHDINKLGREYFKAFGHHLPHPKMDAVVQSLATSWMTGKKTLVFVRRVASVKELKQKLDECYDTWLIEQLKKRLPQGVLTQFGSAVARYRLEKQQDIDERRAMSGAGDAVGDEHDTGGSENFFAWFFRGDGPKGIVSGANIQRRFIQRGSVYSTFFERNHVAEVLTTEPGRVVETLATELGLGQKELAQEIRSGAAEFLSARAKKFPRQDQFIAAQAAALKLIIAKGQPAASDRARHVFQEVYRAAAKKPHANEAPDVAGWLEERTFFTELLTPAWSSLRVSIWPKSQATSAVLRLQEEELRAQLLSTTARLGHGLIDIYVTTIARLGSLEPRTLDSADAAVENSDTRHITDYLMVLETQRTASEPNRPWCAFDELREVATNFDLIIDVNAPEARERPISETARLFGTLLGRQQPVGGMFGQVNRTLVQQFRMPGYPFVLVTTDLLQEGEDLHTFCSSIQHYGISWTPSSMEQRIGRIDRVRSQTDRRLGALARDAQGDELLQVHFPHLQDTVEILQVERVLERMNVFLRLMHEGLVTAGTEDKHIDVGKTLAGRRPVEVITKKLETAFRIQDWAITGDVVDLEVDQELESDAVDRLNALRTGLEASLAIKWEPSQRIGQLFGTGTLTNGRIQPFTLIIDSVSGRILVRCISPVGVVNLDEDRNALEETIGAARVRVGAVLDREDGSYNLTVQEDVLLAESVHDAARVEGLLRRVLEQADRLEMIHLPEGDRAMDVFANDLRQEGGDERD